MTASSHSQAFAMPCSVSADNDGPRRERVSLAAFASPICSVHRIGNASTRHDRRLNSHPLHPCRSSNRMQILLPKPHVHQHQFAPFCDVQMKDADSTTSSFEARHSSIPIRMVRQGLRGTCSFAIESSRHSIVRLSNGIKLLRGPQQ